MKKTIWISMLAVAVLVSAVATTDAADGRRSAEEALQNYFASWNEPDAKQRAKNVAECWAEDGVYQDPTAYVEGRDALVNHIEGFLSSPQFKGFSIVQASGIDEHHDVFRFEWEMKDASGNVVTAGMDYGEINAEGRITKIVGFFGPFPEMN